VVAAGARVEVVAPEATPAVQAMADNGEITWHQRPYADARSTEVMRATIEFFETKGKDKLLADYYERGWYAGDVQPAGIDLKFLANDEPRDIFDRMGGKLEFDASEMSSSEFISGFGAGQSPFVAIPAFDGNLLKRWPPSFVPTLPPWYRSAAASPPREVRI